MHRRLAVLMFLQYAVPGAWVPLFSLHLQDLGFTPTEIGLACATAALGAVGSPLFWGQLADRWVPAERCILVCAVAASLLLWVLAQLTGPVAVFVASLGFWFFMIPILSLGAALTFRHLEHPVRDFGRIRMWGTVGWTSAGWFLGLWFYVDGLKENVDLSDSLRWGAILGAILSAYTLTLPTTPPTYAGAIATGTMWSRWKQSFDAPLRAMRLLARRSFAVYCVCLLGVYVTMPFTGQMTPLLLKHLGVPASWLPVILTLGQSLEIVTLALMPVILFHLEIRNTLLLGIAAWTVVLAILALGTPMWLVIGCLGLQGIYICCFLVAGQVFVNSRARNDFRASAQAMLQIINGTGLLCGHLLVGVMREWTGGDFVIPFTTAACLSASLFVVLLVGFSQDERSMGSRSRETSAPGPTD